MWFCYSVSSLLTEWVRGKTVEQAQEIKNSEIAEELALPPVKFIILFSQKMLLKQLLMTITKKI